VGPAAAFVGMVVAGVALAALSLIVLRASSASPGQARRLAGPAEWKVGRLMGDEPLPARPVRVVGRIRCRDPLDAGDGERLVAFHRDVEVQLGGRWRSVERMRETRSFELWDHDGSLTVDPALAAEPLVTIPQVWRGAASDLAEPHASAAARLSERHAGPATEARSITRTINVTDRLLVVGRAIREPSGAVRLDAPDGGYLISAVALDDAMRLLGGTNRRAAAGGVIGLALATVLLAIGGIGAFLTSVLR
jgi:hypothetical protein